MESKLYILKIKTLRNADNEFIINTYKTLKEFNKR